jgi:hypothetical protein
LRDFYFTIGWGTRTVDNAPINWPFHFAITYSEDEIRTSRKVITARYARGHQGMRFYELAFASPVAVGLVVLGAFELGLIAPISLRPVLITAYAAFTVGLASYYLFMRRYFLGIMRAEDRWQKQTWNWSIDDAGIRYVADATDVRLAWRAFEAVDDLGGLVLLRYGRRHLAIPSRMFSDDAARAAFVGAVAARIKAAAGSAKALLD